MIGLGLSESAEATSRDAPRQQLQFTTEFRELDDIKSSVTRLHLADPRLTSTQSSSEFPSAVSSARVRS